MNEFITAVWKPTTYSWRLWTLLLPTSLSLQRNSPSLLADRELDVEIDVVRASDLLVTAEKRELVLEVTVVLVDAEMPLLIRELFRERDS